MSKMKAADDEIYEPSKDFELLDNNGEVLTPKSWSNLTRLPWQGALQIKIKWLGDDDMSDRSFSASSSRTPDIYDAESVRSVRRYNDHDNAFFGIRKTTTGDSEGGMCTNVFVFTFILDYLLLPLVNTPLTERCFRSSKTEPSCATFSSVEYLGEKFLIGGSSQRHSTRSHRQRVEGKRHGLSSSHRDCSHRAAPPSRS